jgi:hypothetical protein
VTPTDPDTPSSPRRPLLIAAVGVVLLVAALAAALLMRDDPSDSAARSSTADAATSTTDPDPSGDPATNDDATPTAGEGADGAEVDLPVELTPVSGEGEAELCAAIVTRLEEYRDAASNGLPSQELIDALDEFEAQVDTQSDDQDWGDRIVEQTTNVRREWVTALAAERDGNDADADGHNAAAVAFLDQAIDEAGCPTA